jgi:hypothetical protein
MQQFIFVYRLPEGYVPSESTQGAWWSWFESMGSNVLDIGKPAIAASTVGRCGDGVRVAGFSVIAAQDLDKALELAGQCPALRSDGGVEVGELQELRERPDAS